ncbi:hypothetical protein [Burkholderia pseudomallei]|uniref:hypothetical protein n=1 Tax=Burkholderia pseudomallei TaxID=28450 RepID=UPI0011C4CCAA|nr:hypothetical protein [Burkholderia pseudomallei]
MKKVAYIAGDVDNDPSHRRGSHVASVSFAVVCKRRGMGPDGAALSLLWLCGGEQSDQILFGTLMAASLLLAVLITVLAARMEARFRTRRTPR